MASLCPTQPIQHPRLTYREHRYGGKLNKVRVSYNYGYY